MFSAFYEAYQKHFEGTSLVTPVVHPGTDSSSLPVLGCAISHGYVVSGTLPIRIAFPTLAAMLLPHSQLPDEVRINTLIDSLSVYDTMLLSKLLIKFKISFHLFRTKLQQEYSIH